MNDEDLAEDPEWAVLAIEDAQEKQYGFVLPPGEYFEPRGNGERINVEFG